MPVGSSFRPSRTHATLGAEFFDPVDAASFPAHILRYRNEEAAASVALDTLDDEEWIAHFGRFEPLPGSLAQPLALRYHGHQFRTYNPDLGDGRGFLAAQVRDVAGRLMDLGTKGSGQIVVEVCSQCHPFYTGKQKILDSGGRVARFEKRYGKRAK